MDRRSIVHLVHVINAIFTAEVIQTILWILLLQTKVIVHINFNLIFVKVELESIFLLVFLAHVLDFTEVNGNLDNYYIWAWPINEINSFLHFAIC